MNRMQLLDSQSDQGTIRYVDLANRLHRPPQRNVPFHSLFMPLHYEQRYAYPLLIWLHGPGGNEREIAQVMPHISLRNYVAVAPRGCLRDTVRTADGLLTYTWDQTPRCIEQATEDVLQCIEVAKRRCNLAPQRVFLLGNDVGGTMALRLALSMPEVFAGVISLGGRVPNSQRPLLGLERARSLPVMMTHCRDSVIYSTDDACVDLRLLYSAGMSVTLRQYPCEQEVTTQMLSDVNAWVMEQVSGTASRRTVSDDPTRLRLEDCN